MISSLIQTISPLVRPPSVTADPPHAHETHSSSSSRSSSRRWFVQINAFYPDFTAVCMTMVVTGIVGERHISAGNTRSREQLSITFSTVYTMLW